jgi:hypothetical protein
MMMYVPHLHNWKKILVQNHDRVEAASICAQVSARYEELRQEQQPVLQPSQRRQLNQLILPGLALYQSLQAINPTQTAALEETRLLFKATFFSRERRLVSWLNRLPDPFPLVRLGLRQMTRSTGGENAQEIIEDSTHCFALNVYRCFILEVLHTQQAGELTVLYCQTDDWLSEAMPKIYWQRTMTLAHGNKLCDFRWEKRDSPDLIK